LRYFIIFFIIVIIIEAFAQITRPSPYTNDPILGWKLKKNFSFIYNEKDYYNKHYKVDFKTNEFGLIEYKNFSNENKTEKKILVLGDSFTIDPTVSNDEKWFTIVFKELDNKKMNFTAYIAGGGGYGSLQQEITAKQIKSFFNPDFLILQFCSNDFANNYYALEKKSHTFGQYMRRPFYDYKKKIIFYDNNFFSQLLRSNIIGESKLFNKLVFNYQNFLNILYKDRTNVESDADNLYEAKNTTSVILKRLRQEFNDKPFYIMNCDNNDKKLYNSWKEISLNAGYTILESPALNIEKAKNNSEKIYFRDGGHFNQLGNKIFGNGVLKDLLNDKYFNLLVN